MKSASSLAIVGRIPFLPFQTLWVNFTVDLFLAIGLGLGAPSSGLMQRPPRPAHAQILPRRLLVGLAGLGLVVAACTLGVMHWAEGSLDQTVARSMGLVTFSLAGIFLSFEMKEERRSMFSMETFADRTQLRMNLYSLISIIVVTELGLFQRIFDTTSLTPNQWVICLVVASVIVVVMEIVKLIRRQRADAALV